MTREAILMRTLQQRFNEGSINSFDRIILGLLDEPSMTVDQAIEEACRLLDE